VLALVLERAVFKRAIAAGVWPTQREAVGNEARIGVSLELRDSSPEAIRGRH
jgi:hypothetical protein